MSKQNLSKIFVIGNYGNCHILTPARPTQKSGFLLDKNDPSREKHVFLRIFGQNSIFEQNFYLTKNSSHKKFSRIRN